MDAHHSVFVRARGFALRKRTDASVDDAGDGAIPADDLELMSNHDPLAMEPLAQSEIEQVTRHALHAGEPSDMDEEHQLPWRELARITEATFPLDADADALGDVAADSELDVRMRPRSKSR